MQISKEQVDTLIQLGQKKGFTGKEVLDGLIRKGYEPEGVNVQAIKESFVKTEVPTQSKFKEAMGDIKGVGKDIVNRLTEREKNMAEIDMAQEKGEQSRARSVLQKVGQSAGFAGDIITSALKGGVNLALSDKDEKEITKELQTAGENVMAIPGVRAGVERIIADYSALPEKNKRDTKAVAGIVDFLSNFTGVGTAKKAVTEAVDVAVDTAKNVTKKTVGAFDDLAESTIKATDSVGEKVFGSPDEIMNRVARLTPRQASKFESIAGKTHGQYLKETGNFGSPDEIVKKEAIKLSESIKSVDDTLATLEGEFNNGIIDDVLEQLQQKAKATSTKNVDSPITKRVNELTKKNEAGGLSMSEINEMKRLYEKNVKLGYNRLIDGEKIKQATNLDTALREWQVGKADELGFKNLKELNKQTQISKELINSLGDQLVGKTGLNNVNLTDWIVLSGGDPTAVGAFLTKKFFSSKKIQSKIAEWLNNVEAKPTVKPEITPTKRGKQPPQKIKSEKSLPSNIPQKGKVRKEIDAVDKNGLTPTMKDNIVKAIDDFRLNKGKNLSLQEDMSRLAEDLGISMPKNYGELLKRLEALLK